MPQHLAILIFHMKINDNLVQFYSKNIWCLSCQCGNYDSGQCSLVVLVLSVLSFVYRVFRKLMIQVRCCVTEAYYYTLLGSN